jgi:tetratricopeptide (TPR) repeat protein
MIHPYPYKRRIWAAAALFVWLSAGASFSQESASSPLVDREFDFASALISKLNMPDLAEKVMDQVELSYPETKERAKVVRAEALISRRRFPQAEAIVDAMPKDNPKAQAIMLALADGYFQVGEQEKSRLLYVEFFDRYTNAAPTDSDLMRFYRESAYKFGQMLAMRNDPLGASKMYDKMIPLIGADERDQIRQVKVEQAELLLRGSRDLPASSERAANIKKARANCDEVVWGGMDLWFGRAVTGIAQADMIEGFHEKAIQLLEKNIRVIKKSDEKLAEMGMISESPYAAARSLLGAIYKDRADLLTNTREIREAEALRYLERAAGEYESLWSLILRVNQRDANLLDQAKKNKTTITLPGTPSQRQEAYEGFGKSAQQFADLLAKQENEGWSGASAERKNKLKERLQKVLAGITAYDKSIGASLQSDLLIGPAFGGALDIARALEFLASEEARTKQALALYVKALSEFYNVFAGYPGSEWSTTAGEKVTQLKDRLKGLTGQEVTIEAKQGGQEKIARVVIKEGHSLFGRKEYAKAAEQYIKALNDYPEGEESMGALANLMECDVHLKDLLSVKTTANYLGERFADNAQAAQGFLRVGRLLFEAGNREMYQYVYEQYLAAFPNHPSAPDILFMLGEQRWKVEDYEGAVAYYKRLAKLYSKTPRYLQAVNRIGWAYFLSNNFKEAIEGFTAYLEEAQAGSEKAQAKLCLADAYRQLGDNKTAFAHYQELTGWLDNKGGPYSISIDAMRKNEDVHQQAVFFMAHCKTLMAEAGESGAAARRESVALFRKFVDEYPGSTLAPTALSSMGAVLMGEGKSSEASAVFEELTQKYPKSDAGQNAKLAMIRSLIEIGQAAKAQEVLAEMLRDADKIPADQFLRAGLLLQDKGDNASAVPAFAKAIEKLDAATDDASPNRGENEQRGLLALGKAYSALGKFNDAVTCLKRLVEKYPKSALFFEARFLLGNAYKEEGKPEEAMGMLRDVFERATDQKLITQATIELASLQKTLGDSNGALASYQRVVLLGKVDDPAIRPYFRTALYGSVKLFVDAGKWEDVIENSDRFTAAFPTGEGVDDVRKWRSEAIMKISMGASK